MILARFSVSSFKIEFFDERFFSFNNVCRFAVIFSTWKFQHIFGNRDCDDLNV